MSPVQQPGERVVHTAETDDVIREQTATKFYPCDACGGEIRPGQRYLRIVQVPTAVANENVNSFVRHKQAPILKEHIEGQCVESPKG